MVNNWLTSEASWTNVVEVNVLVAQGSIVDDEAELLNEIVVLDPDGRFVGNPWTTPIVWWSEGGNKLDSLSGILTFSSIPFEGR